MKIIIGNFFKFILVGVIAFFDEVSLPDSTLEIVKIIMIDKQAEKKLPTYSPPNLIFCAEL